MLALAVGSGAMIVLFSVFNGFEDLIKDLYKAFYPELKVTAVQGKFFTLPAPTIQALRQTKGVAHLSLVLEDNVLLSANDVQRIATIKGVDAQYPMVNDLRPYIYDGRARVSNTILPTALVGLHIANEMGLDANNVFNRLMVFYPNAAMQPGSLNPTQAFSELELKPDGIFRVQDEVDRKFVVAPIEAVQTLFQQPGKYSSLELSLSAGADARTVQNEIRKTLGNAYKIATRYEQNQTLFMVMQSEKWVAYALLLLVLLIASFNMVGALSLLVLEKKKDMGILRAMGATEGQIRGIFLTEGFIWAAFGGGLGLLAGVGLCYGQMRFGWIKLDGQFIIEAYPVSVSGSDIMLIAITVLAVGLLASIYPALQATRTQDLSLKSS